MPEGKAPAIGRLRNFSHVFEWVDVPQLSGPSLVPGFVPRGDCWCSLKPRGDQLLNGAQLAESPLPTARGSHLVRTRFRQDLTIRHMFEIGDNRYRVVAVRNDDARRFTECEVEEMGDRNIIQAAPPIPRGFAGDDYAGHAD
jgi:hypothetical protein